MLGLLDPPSFAQQERPAPEDHQQPTGKANEMPTTAQASHASGRIALVCQSEPLPSQNTWTHGIFSTPAPATLNSDRQGQGGVKDGDDCGRPREATNRAATDLIDRVVSAQYADTSLPGVGGVCCGRGL